MHAARINVIGCKYHRNGVAGTGFYLVDFRFGRDALRAIVTTTDDDSLPDYRTADFIAVIDPANVDNRFDGPYFESAIIKAINSAVADRSAYDHAPVAP